jgi:hypothetical protein
MAEAQSRSLDSADEVREFPNGKLELVSLGSTTIGRATFEPGWRWSESVKPIAGTESCQTRHTGYIVSGRLGIRMDSGEEFEAGPGDAYDIPPGHEGWVVGDESCVSVDFGMDDYAKKK